MHLVFKSVTENTDIIMVIFNLEMTHPKILNEEIWFLLLSRLSEVQGKQLWGTTQLSMTVWIDTLKLFLNKLPMGIMYGQF